MSTAIQDVAALATAGGFVAAAIALWQSRRVSRAQHFFTLAQFLQGQEIRAARGRILDLIDDDALPETWRWDVGLSDPEKETLRAAGTVASSYDLAGRVIGLGYVDAEPFLDDWGPSIKRMIAALWPFVEQRRLQHRDQRYFDDFAKLAVMVQAWEAARDAPLGLRRLVYRREKRRLRSTGRLLNTSE